MTVIRKHRGRPSTGQDPVTALRLSPLLRSSIEAWAKQQQDKPTRSEAIRQLVQFALEIQANEPDKLYQSAGGAVNTNNIKSDPTQWITIRQVKAARTLVGWSQLDLADHSRLSQPTIARLESAEGRLAGRRETIKRIRAALESAGVEFTNGDQPGVRLRKGAEVGAGEPANEPKPRALGQSRRGSRKR